MVWTVKDIPNLEGKTALVTGATGGLGYETALRLAEAGATVILAGRNEAKGAEALAKLKAACPAAKASFQKVDLASLVSVREFAASVSSSNEKLDILVNNAGVMAPPKRETTADGFELQLGTNHLSHFALTALLLPLLRKSESPRVVTVSSIAARQGKICFDDLQSEKSYFPWPIYGQSKLANILFTFELQRRSDEGKWGIRAVAAHPGFSRTELVSNGPGDRSFSGVVTNYLLKPVFSQSVEDGALPQLYAATCPDAEPGGYYGPQGFLEMRGTVGPVTPPANAKNLETAKRLWEESEKLTNVSWPSC